MFWRVSLGKKVVVKSIKFVRGNKIRKGFIESDIWVGNWEMSSFFLDEWGVGYLVWREDEGKYKVRGLFWELLVFGEVRVRNKR